MTTSPTTTIYGLGPTIWQGLPVHVDDSLGVIYERRQCRFPRSKRRRIRRKWAKDPLNYVWVRGSKPSVYIVAGKILCNSAGLLSLRSISLTIDRPTP